MPISPFDMSSEERERVVTLAFALYLIKTGACRADQEEALAIIAKWCAQTHSALEEMGKLKQPSN